VSGENSWVRRIAWGLYDLANTIFSMNVISLYFPLWLASTYARGEIFYALTYSLSMLVCGLVSPFLGDLGDRVGHKRILLIVTVLAAAATFGLGFMPSLVTVLILFAVANVSFQIALVSYNALLPSVSTERDRGRVSGVGVALGYLGSFCGMLIALPFVDRGKLEALPELLRGFVRTLSIQDQVAGEVVRQNAFVPTAILFALFSIPIFLLVRELRIPAVESRRPILAEVKSTFFEILRDPNLRNFYLSTFLYMDAVHTVYIVMATYAKFAIGLSEGRIVTVMSVAILTAVAGSFLYGWVTDRVERRTAIYLVIVNWIVALILAGFASGFGQFLVVAMVAGIGLGGVEVVARVALLSLVPSEQRGRFLGFFNLTGKASSIVGPWLWAGTLFLMEGYPSLRYRVAVLVLLVPTLLALAFVRKIQFVPVAEAEVQ